MGSAKALTRTITDVSTATPRSGDTTDGRIHLRRGAGSAASHLHGRVRIERLILHGVDNHTGRLQLVDDPATLSGDSAAFFALHIETAATRSEWRARFAEPEGEVHTLCCSLLDGHEAFVSASRRLARRLFDSMRSRAIAPGDFVAAVYTRGDDARRHVALLKLDPDQRLARTYTRHAGRTRVTISAAENLLPDISRLQKCALLTLPAPGAGFEVALLDTQAGPRADGIAAFFYRGFLAAELLPSPRRRTRDFLRCCDSWLLDERDTLSPAEVTTFYAARRLALSTDVLDIAVFTAAAFPGRPDLAAKLHERLTTTLQPEDFTAGDVCRSFRVDPAAAAGVTGRVTLELDGGARLTVPAERFAELVRIDPSRTADNKVRIVIESLTLKEVSER